MEEHPQCARQRGSEAGEEMGPGRPLRRVVARGSARCALQRRWRGRCTQHCWYRGAICWTGVRLRPRLYFFAILAGQRRLRPHLAGNVSEPYHAGSVLQLSLRVHDVRLLIGETGARNLCATPIERRGFWVLCRTVISKVFACWPSKAGGRRRSRSSSRTVAACRWSLRPSVKFPWSQIRKL